MADENQIYLRIDGKEHGPLTVPEVKDWIDQGRFRRTDFIRTANQKTWVKAENLVHLKALFDEARAKVTRGAFDSWLNNVRTGKTTMVLSAAGRVAERKRVEEEQAVLAEDRERLEAEERALRDKLERAVADREAELARIELERAEERKRLEAQRDEEFKQLAAEREAERKRLLAEREAEVKRVTQDGKREMERLSGERERLDKERARLAEEERELAQMGKSVRARRRLPIIVAAIVLGVAIFAGVPSWYFLLYKPGEEQRERNARMADVERRMTDLTAQLEAALKAGDTAKAAEITKEIAKVKAEKEKLTKEVPPSERPKMNTSRGKAKLAGLLRAEGGGASDPSRSSSAIGAGLSGGMGGVHSTYSRELSKYPGLSGYVIISMKVGADGGVTNAHVVSSTIGNSAVESAVTAAARGSQFAPAAGDTTLTYKFEFSP